MRSIITAAALAATAYAAPTAKRDTAQSPDLGLPAGCMTSYKNITFGFLPDYHMSDPRMGTINADTGKQSCTYGYYSQITSSSYDDSQITASDVMSDIKNSGAVFVPSIMPTGLAWNQITTDVASQIGSTVQKFTSQGITVWLRFAHEMNYYVTDGTYPGGSTDDFQTAWQNVHAACAAIEGCLMFWSPNRDSVDNIQPFWPGDDYVDIVGMDYYADDGDTFTSAYTDFYNQFSAGPDKHFIIGEAGTTGDDSAGAKENWLQQVTMQDYSAFPNYQGCMWYEYGPSSQADYDFRIVIGQDSDTVTETLSNFQ